MSDALIGVLIGGAISVAANYFQHKHSIQRDREARLQETRRQVYLGAASEIAGMVQVWTALVNLAEPVPAASVSMASLSNIAIVGSDKSARLASGLIETWGNGYATLLEMRIRALQDDADTVAATVAMVKEVDRQSDILVQFLVQGLQAAREDLGLQPLEHNGIVSIIQSSTRSTRLLAELAERIAQREPHTPS